MKLFDSKILKTNFLLIIYGLIFSILCIKHFIGQVNPNVYMPSLISIIQNAMEDFKTISITNSWNSKCYGVLCVVITKVFNINTAACVEYHIQLGCCLILIAVYPILFFHIFNKNVLIGFFSPFILYIFAGPIMFRFIDDKWALFWIILIGLPLIKLILITEKDNVKFFLIIFTVFLCGFSNCVRAQSSLGVLCILVIIFFYQVYILFIKQKKLYNKQSVINIILLFLMFILCLQFFRVIFPAMVIAIYNISHGVKLPLTLRSFGPWHTLYIGLGWHDNPFGIIYSDSCAAKRAFELAPGCKYCDRVYMSALRNEWFKLFCGNVDYFIKDYLYKFVVICKQCLNTFMTDFKSIFSKNFVLFLFVSSVYFCWYQKTSIKEQLSHIKEKGHILYIIIIVFVTLIGMIPPLCAVPNYWYQIGAIAGIWYAFIYSLLCILNYFQKKIWDLFSNLRLK